MIDLTNPTRAGLIAGGLIIEHPDLHDQYADNLVGPSCAQPFVRAPCLRLDALGKFWAAEDVLMTIQEDYSGMPPSAAATRFMYEAGRDQR